MHRLVTNQGWTHFRLFSPAACQLLYLVLVIYGQLTGDSIYTLGVLWLGIHIRACGNFGEIQNPAADRIQISEGTGINSFLKYLTLR